ncbi:MAG TPA: hypothetical protein VER36_02690, partial [Flavisolibacter sp.]|nr:hypothetical protein [Flavisolibacter sp.]
FFFYTVIFELVKVAQALNNLRPVVRACFINGSSKAAKHRRLILPGRPVPHFQTPVHFTLRMSPELL